MQRASLNADAAKIAALLLELDGGITTAQAAIGAEEVAAQNVKQCTLTKGKALDALGGVVSRISTFAEDEFPDAPEKAVGLGLDLRAENSPIGPLSASAGMSVTGGDHPGTLEGACYPVLGRDIYEGEIATHPEGPYTRVYVGKVSNFIVPDLVSGLAAHESARHGRVQPLEQPRLGPGHLRVPPVGRARRGESGCDQGHSFAMRTGCGPQQKNGAVRTVPLR